MRLEVRVIFRADGNSIIGLGHVYRLLALAEILNKHFQCVFVINRPDPFLASQILISCSEIVNLELDIVYKTPDDITPGNEIPFDLSKIIGKDDIVVTDGYLFGTNYQRSVKATGAGLVCIDDLGAIRFHSDVIINHAPGLKEGIYVNSGGRRVFTGLDYAILREPFFSPFVKIEKNRAFVSLGGSDVNGYTVPVVESIAALAIFDGIDILASSSFSERLLKELEEISKSFPSIKIHLGLTATEIVKVLDNCSHSFVAASTVLLESYSRGIKCFAGYYAENQQSIYEGFVGENLARGFGHFNDWPSQNVEHLLSGSESLKILDSPLSSPNRLLEIFKGLC